MATYASLEVVEVEVRGEWLQPAAAAPAAAPDLAADHEQLAPVITESLLEGITLAPDSRPHIWRGQVYRCELCGLEVAGSDDSRLFGRAACPGVFPPAAGRPPRLPRPDQSIARLQADVLRGMALYAARSTTEAYEAALEGGWLADDEQMAAMSRLLTAAWAHPGRVVEPAPAPGLERFPLTVDARKLAVDVAQAAATAAGVFEGEDIAGVRRAVARVLADNGVIVRVHWAHPEETVPACMVAGTVKLTDQECQASRERDEVTCAECRAELPPAERFFRDGQVVRGPAPMGAQGSPPGVDHSWAKPASRPDDTARGEWLSLASAWHDHETADAWDRGEVLPWMKRIVELAEPGREG